MTPIEWIATVMAGMVFVKFTLLMINPEGFIKWATKFITNKNITIIRYVYLILFFVLAYYLLQELTIVQFLVAILAGMLLIVHTFAHYPKMLNVYIKQFKGKNPMYKIMFDWFIWLAMAAWVLKEIFF
jgi:hypothetical protein